jgi:hypothetical protein
MRASRRAPAQALEKFKTRLTNTLERGEHENECVLRTRVSVDAPVFGLQSVHPSFRTLFVPMHADMLMYCSAD